MLTFLMMTSLTGHLGEEIAYSGLTSSSGQLAVNFWFWCNTDVTQFLSVALFSIYRVKGLFAKTNRSGNFKMQYYKSHFHILFFFVQPA